MYDFIGEMQLILFKYDFSLTVNHVPNFQLGNVDGKMKLKGRWKYPIEYTTYTFNFYKSKNQSIYLVL